MPLKCYTRKNNKGKSYINCSDTKTKATIKAKPKSKPKSKPKTAVKPTPFQQYKPKPRTSI